MDQVWVGVAEIGLGLVFCFLGHTAARVVLGVWGAVVGFVTGGFVYLLLHNWLGGGVLDVVPIQVFSVVMALLLAWLAFAFYAVGVLLSMGSVGWGIGLVLSQALNLPGWLTLALAGVVAAGLVMVGWALNLPRLLLVVLTALVGAGAVVDGIQLLLGRRIAWFDDAVWRIDFGNQLAWTGAFAALAIAGITVQLRQHSEENLRAAYKSA